MNCTLWIGTLQALRKFLTGFEKITLTFVDLMTCLDCKQGSEFLCKKISKEARLFGKNAENFSTKALAIKVVLFTIWWKAYETLKLLKDLNTLVTEVTFVTLGVGLKSLWLLNFKTCWIHKMAWQELQKSQMNKRPHAASA